MERSHIQEPSLTGEEQGAYKPGRNASGFLNPSDPQRRGRRPFTIRFRLAVLVIACVLPVWLGAGFLIYYSYQSRRALMERHMLDTAHALTLVVDRELANIQASLEALATSPSLRAGDLAGFHVQASDVLSRYPGADIILADQTGQQLVNTFQPPGASLPKRNVPEAVRRVYLTGKPSITNLFQGAVTGRHLIGVDVPVFRDGRVVYDLGMTLPVDHLATVLEQQHLIAGWVGTIVDSQGMVAARTRLAEQFVGRPAGPVLLRKMAEAEEGTVAAVNLEGTPVFVAFSRSEASGWTVVIGVPRALMMAEIWRWLSWTVVGVALLSIVGIALALWMAQNIARSIQALIVPALALGRGEPINVGNFDLAETSEVGESLAKASELLRRQKQELLQKSEQRYHSLFENMLDGFAYCKMLYDGEGRPLDFICLDVNSEFARITGLQNVEGKRGTEVLPGVRESHPELFETYGRVALTGRPERFEIELKPLGIWFFISVYSTEKGYFAAVFHNITEKKRAEQALVRSEKLASVGRMAATIAHEINNPLAAAMNALYLVWSSPEVPDSARTNLDLAEQELERVAHITKQTLGFYRETGNSTAVQLPDLLDDVLMMYGPKLNNKNASVERRYRSGASVYAIEGEVRQVVSNLIANGIDAMPQNGTLYVRTSGPSAANGLLAMVQLTIADNGSGIPPENMRQIFEPFFTTKQSVGTGLGLWVTKELVRKHDGKLRVRSRVGEGTVFVIWLPTERRKQERKN